MPDRPNVLIIMWDEMRWDTLGYMGHPHVHTPNLDRLAAVSINFTDHHTVSPVCAPSRHAFFSGKYPHITGTPAGNLPLAPGQRYWPQLMNEAGYRSACVGKLHHTPTNEGYGFDPALITDSRLVENNAWYAWLASRGLHYDMTDKCIPSTSEPARARLARGESVGWGRSRIPDEHTETAYTADRAVEFLSDPPPEPFFYLASFKQPHTPHLPPEPYNTMYDWQQVDQPDIPEGDLEGKSPMFHWMRNRSFGSGTMTRNEWADRRAHYYGLITQMDAHVGRILDAVEQTGRLDDTVIVFTSDHGTMVGEHGFYGKFFNYEESTRIPCLVHLPGQAEARQVDRTCTNIDIMPTVMDYCGVPVPGDLQGRSMRPLVEDPSSEWDERFLMSVTGIARNADLSNPHYNVFRRGLRTKDWKITFECSLVEGTWQRHWELIDRNADPRELTNLAGRPEVRDAFDLMKEELFLAVLHHEGTLDFSRYGEGVE